MPTNVKLYDHVSNSGIVQMPGRSFPAVAIQGDSLSIMLTAALSFMEKAKEIKDEELFYEALMLAENLQGHLCHYEDVLLKEGLRKPYSLTAKELNIQDDYDQST